MRSSNAIHACAIWLAECLKLGWAKSDLDYLEQVWWTYHDDNGNLTVGG
jgi:hypothetical protein